ncbi:MAG: flippase [Promethearchaeota archaeon]
MNTIPVDKVKENLESSLKIIAKGTGVIFIGLIIGQLFGIINQSLMGRFLQPEKYGLFSLGLSLITMFTIFATFGLGSGLAQYIPYNIIKNRKERVISAVEFSLKYCFGVSIFISVIIFILSSRIAIKIFHNSDLIIVIKILCIALPFTAFSRLAENFPRGFKEPKYKVYYQDILMKIIRITIFIVGIILGYKIYAALFAYICATIFVSFGYIYILYKKFIPLLNCKNKDKSAAKDLISISLPLFFAGITLLLMGHTDRIILGIYMSPADIGIYVASFTIASLMNFFFNSFRYIFLPVISEYSAREDISGMHILFFSVTKWIFLFTLPVVGYLFFYSKNLISLIYGKHFISASSALIILSMGIAMNGLTGMTGEILVAIKKTKLNLLCEIIGLISNIGLNIILIPKYGIIGAAIGTSISIATRNIASLVFVYKELKIHPYNITYIKIFFAFGLPLILIHFLFAMYLNIKWDFLVFIPIFFIFYMFILFSTNCFNEYDKFILKSIRKKLSWSCSY